MAMDVDLTAAGFRFKSEKDLCYRLNQFTFDKHTVGEGGITLYMKKLSLLISASSYS